MCPALLSDTINKIITPYNVFSSDEVKLLLTEAEKEKKGFQAFLLGQGIIKPASVSILNTIKRGYLRLESNEVLSIFDIEKAQNKLKNLKKAIDREDDHIFSDSPLFSFDDEENDSQKIQKPTREVKAGDFIGKYEIIKKIGSGATCSVYLVKHKILKTDFALKLLSEEALKNKNLDQSEVFIDEAINTAHLNHENLIKVFDAEKNDEHTYMIMEYINGNTLQEVLDIHKTIAESSAIQVIKRLCSALDYAFNNKIIHRDIKPGNVLISKTGEVKLSDLGLAKTLNSPDKYQTTSGNIIGTPYYMPPESYTGFQTDHRSDIYSLGITFYQMLAGEVPFDGNSLAEVMNKHMSEKPKDIFNLNTKVSERTNEVVLKMIEKKPENRYQNYSELLTDLINIQNMRT